MVKLVTMTLSNMDREVQMEDLESMRFRKDIQPEITGWISLISTANWTVVDVQKHILNKNRSCVPGLRELLQPAFTDSESLNIPCTLDNNYLRTITSCTPGPYYKRIVLVWPGGRQEVWELTLGKSPRNGETYIENFIYSQWQNIGERVVVPAKAKVDMCVLLRRLEGLK